MFAWNGNVQSEKQNTIDLPKRRSLFWSIAGEKNPGSSIYHAHPSQESRTSFQCCRTRYGCHGSFCPLWPRRPHGATAYLPLVEASRFVENEIPGASLIKSGGAASQIESMLVIPNLETGVLKAELCDTWNNFLLLNSGFPVISTISASWRKDPLWWYVFWSMSGAYGRNLAWKCSFHGCIQQRYQRGGNASWVDGNM